MKQIRFYGNVCSFFLFELAAAFYMDDMALCPRRHSGGGQPGTPKKIN